MTPMTPTPTSGVEWQPIFPSDPELGDQAWIAGILFRAISNEGDADYVAMAMNIGSVPGTFPSLDLAKNACLKRAGEIGRELVKASGGEDELEKAKAEIARLNKVIKEALEIVKTPEVK